MMRVGIHTLSPSEFLKAVYPDEYKLMGSAKFGEAGVDEDRLEAARAGEYRSERKPHPRVELETLSATARIEKTMDRIELMMRYIIANMPEKVVEQAPPEQPKATGVTARPPLPTAS
jgi:hypothetical protein